VLKSLKRVKYYPWASYPASAFYPNPYQFYLEIGCAHNTSKALIVISILTTFHEFRDLLAIEKQLLAKFEITAGKGASASA